MSEHVGEKLVFGIRPEDIMDSLFVEDKNAERIEAIVDVVEPLGSEIFVHLKIGDHELLARFPPVVNVKAGDKMKVVFNMKKIHLFKGEEAIV